MNKHNENRAEAWVNEKIRQILHENPVLAEGLLSEALDADMVANPDFADYLGDLVLQRLDGREPTMANIRAILQGHAVVREDAKGRMVIQRTELWERYPLEALLRLLWRTRKRSGEVIFLRGREPVGDYPVLWRAEVRREGEDWVLVCQDEDRRNYMYLTTAYQDYELDWKTFGHELRDFLGFHEGTVWLSNQYKQCVKEVTE